MTAFSKPDVTYTRVTYQQWALPLCEDAEDAAGLREALNLAFAVPDAVVTTVCRTEGGCDHLVIRATVTETAPWVQR